MSRQCVVDIYAKINILVKIENIKWENGRFLFSVLPYVKMLLVLHCELKSIKMQRGK